jgi:hypothetical protein
MINWTVPDIQLSFASLISCAIPTMVKRNTILVRLILTGKARTTGKFLHHWLGTGTTCEVGIPTHRCKVGRPCSEIMVGNRAENGCARTMSVARARVE